MRRSSFATAVGDSPGAIVLVALCRDFVTARGSLDGTIEGTAQVEQTDLPALVEVLRVTNVAAIEGDMVRSGTLEGDIRVAGELGDPNVEGHALIHDASAPQFDAPLVQLDFSGRVLQPQLSSCRHSECRRRRSGAARCARRGTADGHATRYRRVVRQPTVNAGPPDRHRHGRLGHEHLYGDSSVHAVDVCPNRRSALAGSLDLSFG